MHTSRRHPRAHPDHVGRAGARRPHHGHGARGRAGLAKPDRARERGLLDLSGRDDGVLRRVRGHVLLVLAHLDILLLMLLLLLLAVHHYEAVKGIRTQTQAKKEAKRRRTKRSTGEDGYT